MRQAVRHHINLLKVRNVESTVCFSLDCAKDTASNGGGLASYIEESVEGASVLDTIMRLNDDNTGAGWCLRSPRSLQVPKWQEKTTSLRGIYRRKAM
mmetsp:Transcript_37373/g.55946  ORF Transcript_37373/g.55946 Transcript_37373/m.55946 type:complete len:97 (+) Transcript_37373:458-748(+)